MQVCWRLKRTAIREIVFELSDRTPAMSYTTVHMLLTRIVDKGYLILEQDRGNNYYTPEFPRGGLSGNFAINISQMQGGPTVTAKLQHRNEDETSFSDAGTFASITAVGMSLLNATNIKEICRIEIAFDAGDDATDAIHFLIQAPSWRPY